VRGEDNYIRCRNSCPPAAWLLHASALASHGGSPARKSLMGAAPYAARRRAGRRSDLRRRPIVSTASASLPYWTITSALASVMLL
jgi:hypothetical protein